MFDYFHVQGTKLYWRQHDPNTDCVMSPYLLKCSIKIFYSFTKPLFHLIFLADLLSISNLPNPSLLSASFFIVRKNRQSHYVPTGAMFFIIVNNLQSEQSHAWQVIFTFHPTIPEDTPPPMCPKIMVHSRVWQMIKRGLTGCAFAKHLELSEIQLLNLGRACRCVWSHLSIFVGFQIVEWDYVDGRWTNWG